MWIIATGHKERQRLHHSRKNYWNRMHHDNLIPLNACSIRRKSIPSTARCYINPNTSNFSRVTLWRSALAALCCTPTPDTPTHVVKARASLPASAYTGKACRSLQMPTYRSLADDLSVRRTDYSKNTTCGLCTAILPVEALFSTTRGSSLLALTAFPSTCFSSYAISTTSPSTYPGRECH